MPGVGKMLNCRKRLHRRVIPLFLFLVVLFPFFQSACFKKTKVRSAAASPVKMLLLPFEVAKANKDLSWTALAVPILLAKKMEETQDLTIIPLWQTMPRAIATAGASRSFNDESAASAANWLGAKWSIMGTVSTVKSRLSITIIFIPGKRNQFAFRYNNAQRIESLGPAFHEAIRQFLRYQLFKPLGPSKGNEANLNSVKELAEALDREYGWSEAADPGKAQDIVARLAKSDERLARLLFNPNLYPILDQNKDKDTETK
jgi:hypothetical protein